MTKTAWAVKSGVAVKRYTAPSAKQQSTANASVKNRRRANPTAALYRSESDDEFRTVRALVDGGPLTYQFGAYQSLAIVLLGRPALPASLEAVKISL